MPTLRFMFCLLMLFTLISCNSNKPAPKYLITTKVPIKEGKINDVLELFKKSNHELVKDQSDWVSASFTQNLESNTVKVLAYWKSKESYMEFSRSIKFQETMKQFGKYFNGKPEIEVNEILFRM